MCTSFKHKYLDWNQNSLLDHLYHQCTLQKPELMWCLSLSDWENGFLHWGQVWGFSPVWTLKCFCKAWESPKIFVQREHANGFSPVWTLKCERKWVARENDFVHWGQVWGFSPVWTLIWVFRFSNLANGPTILTWANKAIDGNNKSTWMIHK